MRSSSFLAERANVTVYSATSSETFPGYQTTFYGFNGFARLVPPRVGKRFIENIFPELRILFQIDEYRGFLAIFIDEELYAFHSYLQTHFSIPAII